MYHCNPACIKQMLSTMPDADLLRHVRYIRKQMNELPEGNRQFMFGNLYSWSNQHIRTCRPGLLSSLFNQ